MKNTSLRIGDGLNIVPGTIYIQKLSQSSYIQDCPTVRKDLGISKPDHFTNLKEMGLTIWRGRIRGFPWVYGKTLAELTQKLEQPQSTQVTD
jgi:hypothetical protein